MRDLIRENAELILHRLNLSPLAGKDLLIIGGSGLIGVNLLTTLRACPEIGSITALRSLQGLKAESYDYIIHAGGYAQPARFMAEPMETIAVNTTGLMSLINALRSQGRLIYLSSSEVCSGNTKGIYTENDIGTTNPACPRGAYIESKRCGEAICHAANTQGKRALVARVSSVYGPGVKANDRRVMSDLINGGLTNGYVSMAESGCAVRVWCYVSDAVEMLLNILLHAKGVVYNVGGAGAVFEYRGSGNIEGEITVATMARRIADLLHVPLKIKRLHVIEPAASEGAPSHVALDVSRYQREFGQKTYIPLEQGLKRTIEYHRQLLGVRVLDTAVA